MGGGCEEDSRYITTHRFSLGTLLGDNCIDLSSVLFIEMQDIAPDIPHLQDRVLKFAHKIQCLYVDGQPNMSVT